MLLFFRGYPFLGGFIWEAKRRAIFLGESSRPPLGFSVRGQRKSIPPFLPHSSRRRCGFSTWPPSGPAAPVSGSRRCKRNGARYTVNTPRSTWLLFFVLYVHGSARDIYYSTNMEAESHMRFGVRLSLRFPSFEVRKTWRAESTMFGLRGKSGRRRGANISGRIRKPRSHARGNPKDNPSIAQRT